MLFGITAKPRTLGNPKSNEILERIHQVLVKRVRTFNITQTYVDKDDPWLGIFAATAFAICLTKSRLKVYSQGKLVFVRDMILPIKHMVD